MGITRKGVLEAMDRTPTFWNTVLSSLQHSTFITLGRIFGTGRHDFNKLLRSIQDNKVMFTKAAFSERWENNPDKGQLGNYLQTYLKHVYEPSQQDFDDLVAHFQKQRDQYESIYRDIRHHFGHRLYIRNEEIEKLFNAVNIVELEKFCVNLEALWDALWNQYHNGRGPMLPLKRKRYSTRNILKGKTSPYKTPPSNAQYIYEAQTALKMLEKGKPKKPKLR
ncbi:MAG: hypothetical protein AB203_02565 [Parcubacteria bacterium C7867-008]|nr:MAG: hypothetical protein AB203_02565 [Parcubacteria bacterium C7867-008]